MIKDSYEEKFEKLGREWPVIAKLGSIPGIGSVRAATICAIICSPNRFANKHKLWSYCSLVRHLDESDGRIYGSRKAHGRLELKAAFMGAASAALQRNNGLRRYYDRLRTQGVSQVSHRNARKAVARRIAAISLMTMKTGKRYDDKHEEKRRRRRTSKA